MKNNEKWDQIINKIITTLICIALILCAILVGNPINNNTIIINIIVIITAIIWIIWKKIPRKEKILKNKIDKFICILCFSTLIPVIFNTYTTLTGAINYIIKYITLFLIYIIIKDLCKNNKKLIQYIINITIIMAIILTVIGIDKMTTNVLLPFTKAINSSQIEYEEIRMDSLFSYANSFAITISFALILAIGEYLKNNNKIKKYLLSSTIFILETAVILSFSRIVFIFLILILIIYLIALKKKEQILEVIKLITISGITALIYSTLYMKFLALGKYSYIWILLPVFATISSTIILLTQKLDKYILKIKIKNLILAIITITISVILIIAIGLNLEKPLTMFNSRTSSKEITKELYRVKSNEEYNFNFDIKAKTPFNKIETFKISILEKNKYFDNIKQTDIEFGNYEGNKEINIRTDEDTTEIFIIFSTKITEDDMYLIVKSLTINGKKEILNYQYLPSNLVNKIKNINLNTKSAWERGVFITDGIKLIKDNWVFGIGGDGWKYRQVQVQNYLYGAKEVHCYPVQIFLEFGIIGFLAFIAIIYYYTKNSLKYLKENKEKDNVEIKTILLAILLVFLHSLLDFDMSFMYVAVYIFTFLGILNSLIYSQKEEKKSKNITNIIILLILIILLVINILNYIIYEKLNILYEENEINKIETILNDLNKYPTYIYNIKLKNVTNKNPETEEENIFIIKNAKYMIKYEKYKDKLEMCQISLKCYMNLIDNNYDKYINEIKEIVNIALNTPINQKYSINENIQRQLTYIRMADELQEKNKEKQDEKLLELSKKLYQQVVNEYPETKNRVIDYKRCRYNKNEKEKNIKVIEQNFEEAKNKLRD